MPAIKNANNVNLTNTLQNIKTFNIHQVYDFYNIKTMRIIILFFVLNKEIMKDPEIFKNFAKTYGYDLLKLKSVITSIQLSQEHVELLIENKHLLDAINDKLVSLKDFAHLEQLQLKIFSSLWQYNLFSINEDDNLFTFNQIMLFNKRHLELLPLYYGKLESGECSAESFIKLSSIDEEIQESQEEFEIIESKQMTQYTYNEQNIAKMHALLAKEVKFKLQNEEDLGEIEFEQ